MWVTTPVEAQDIEALRFFKFDIQNAARPQQLAARGPRRISSTSKEVPIALEGQLRFPLKLKGSTMVIGEINYGHRSLNGFYSLAEEDDVDIDLSKMSIAVIGLHQFSDYLVLKSRVGLKNSGHDLFKFGTRSTLISTTHLVEKGLAQGRFGLGARLAYRNRFTILPVLLYQQDYGLGWSLDVLLPVKIFAIKKLDSDMRLILGVTGDSDNYFISKDLAVVDMATNYRRISANTVVKFEKQLTHLLGVGVEVGASIPFFSGLYSLDKRWQEIHDFEEHITPYAKVGLFCAIGH